MIFLSTQGPDYAQYRVDVHENMQHDNVPVDEINDYWNGRYLSSGEAVWRILGFNITKKEPSVTTMSVHLVNDRTFVQYH
jgi:hypothetical protein